jgi:hypothetical protein
MFRAPKPSFVPHWTEWIWMTADSTEELLAKDERGGKLRRELEGVGA